MIWDYGLWGMDYEKMDTKLQHVIASPLKWRSNLIRLYEL